MKKAKKKGNKLYAIFVDLKAAFDTVNRDKLWETMEKGNINKYLIERIKEIYEETKVKIRLGEIINYLEFFRNNH